MEDPYFRFERGKVKKEARKIYNKIGRVWCPALNDYVSFNSVGFRHLIWKGKEYRSPRQQHKRLALLSYAPAIILNAKTPDTRRVKMEYTKIKWRHEKKTILSNVTFWAFKAEADGKPVRIIVRQIGNGHKHFFSVFQERKQKTALS
jgi:hypothetical protein